LNTVNAEIDCVKEKVRFKFGDVSHEFNFSKFSRQTHKKELFSKDKILGLASIIVPPADPLEQYLLDHENDTHMNKRNEIDEILFKQAPILEHSFPIETSGDPLPPKSDPMYELKKLHDTLKYAYLDEKKIYHVIINVNLSEHEEKRLLKTLRKHHAAIGYTHDDLKGISPTLCQPKINMELGAKPVIDLQCRPNPKMEDVVRTEILKLLEAGIIHPN